MNKYLLTSIFTLGALVGLQAQTRYISTAGVDTSDCSIPGNPCATISNAVAQAVHGDTIKVATGLYSFAGSQVIDKSVILMGQDSLVKPIITANSVNILQVLADSVTISNIRIEMGLTIADGLAGIVASGTYNNLQISNCEIISTKPIGAGMVFNSYGIVASGGIGQSISISNTIIEPLDSARDAHGRGVGIGLNGTPGPGASIYGNTIRAYYPIQSIETTADVICDDNFFTGYVLVTYPSSGTTTFTNNTFDGYNDQVAANLTALLELRAFNDNAAALIQGNEFVNYKNIGLFSSASRNITVLENEFSPSDSATEFISIYANTKLFTAGTQNTNYSNQIAIKGNMFNAGLDSMGAAIVFGDHYGLTTPAFEDTIQVGGPDVADKNIFDTNNKYFIALDTLSGPSNSVSFWSGYSVSNMVPFSQSVYALAAYNEYNISDTVLLEEKMFDSLEIAGLGKVILFDSLVVTSFKNNQILSLNVFPNPSQDFITLQSQELTGTTFVSVFDMEGKLIHQSQKNVINNTLIIPVQSFAKGQYLILFQNNNKVYQSKFVKE